MYVSCTEFNTGRLFHNKVMNFSGDTLPWHSKLLQIRLITAIFEETVDYRDTVIDPNSIFAQDQSNSVMAQRIRALNIIWNFSFPGVYNIKFKILQIPLTYIYNIITLISMNNDYKCNNHNKKSKLYNRVSLKCRLLLWYHNRHCNRLKRQAAKLI